MAGALRKKRKEAKSPVWSHKDPIPHIHRPALENQEISPRRGKKVELPVNFLLGAGVLVFSLGLLFSKVFVGTISPVESKLLSESSKSVESDESSTLALAKKKSTKDSVSAPISKTAPEIKDKEQVKNLPRSKQEKTPQITTLALKPEVVKSVSVKSEEVKETKSAPKILGRLKEPKKIEVVSSLRSDKLDHVVRTGETLISIFSKYGFRATDAHKIDKLLRKSDHVNHLLRPGQEIAFLKGPGGILDSLKMDLDRVKSIEISREGDALGHEAARTNFNLALREKVIFEKEVETSGVVESTLAEAAVKSGVSYRVVDEFVDLFGDNVRFHKDLRKGDRFSLIYNKKVLDDGSDVGDGALLAGGIRVGGETYQAFKVFDKEGVPHIVDRAGEVIDNSFLRYPLKFSRISSYFSHSRLHPILKRRKPHHGVDFAAPSGTPVRSVADGRVAFAGRKGPNGIMLKINHGRRYKTAYLHLKKISSGLKVGSLVKRGQVVGAVGSTGRSTGPHLDFRFYDRGKMVDPLKVKLPKMELDKNIKFDRKSFQERVDKLDRLLQVQSVSSQDSISTGSVKKSL